MRSSPIRVGLIVGIGKGVWSKRLDRRLGDVMVSHPVGAHGGVVQWDFGTRSLGSSSERDLYTSLELTC
jgi:hypothetical protein